MGSGFQIALAFTSEGWETDLPRSPKLGGSFFLSGNDILRPFRGSKERGKEYGGGVLPVHLRVRRQWIPVVLPRMDMGQLFTTRVYVILA